MKTFPFLTSSLLSPSLGRFQRVLAAAALLTVPANSSIACGGHEGGYSSYSNSWYSEYVPAAIIDVSDYLEVQESWVRRALPAKPAAIAPASAKGSSKAAAKKAKAKPAPTAYTKVRVLSVSGPEGAEVTIERRLPGGAWELADVFTLGGTNATWQEPRCNGNCPNYQYRCTATLFREAYTIDGGGGF